MLGVELGKWSARSMCLFDVDEGERYISRHLVEFQGVERGEIGDVGRGEVGENCGG